MIRSTLAAVPNGKTVNVVYPASVSQNSASGTAFIVNAVKSGVAACPGQKFALLGYSQMSRWAQTSADHHGAAASVDAMKQMTSGPAFDAIAASVLLGNPQRCVVA